MQTCHLVAIRDQSIQRLKTAFDPLQPVLIKPLGVLDGDQDRQWPMVALDQKSLTGRSLVKDLAKRAPQVER